MRRLIPIVVVIAVAALAWASVSALRAGSDGSSATTSPASVSAPLPGGSNAPAFAFYYLWWSRQHWHDKLGPNYPYGANPLPVPASLPADGCPPVSLYPGNQLTDAPAKLWSQDDPGQIASDERQAASAGLTGFAVNWVGGPTYSARLAKAFRGADALRAQGVPFSLVLSYKSSAKVLPLSKIQADLTYYRDHYASDPAQYELNGKPVVILQGSHKYDDAALAAINTGFGDTFRIIGDETPTSYTAQRGASMYGVSYYWSTQDPYQNPASFGQLQQFAIAVRATPPNADGSPKQWWAPFTPGYDGVLLGGSTCIPRNDGETMRSLFDGNAATAPDAWTLISWNEIAEGTYVDPLQRYGDRYLQTLRQILGTRSSG
ncbi:MAG TPA: hypothetical protein VHW68_00145 [Actinomycetota bacterium]|nr:hypothetical protein [Actinomycetota bacterium]